ncbi:hypothetical protein [Piscinibacter sp. XHJ-5]|uniref:hypothetical protein n=1 Tax=Piscinibacter sp. XHJ-5 TaxID=3037797 RepID=UPI0024529FC2|nr:hypothetical protein [Piscinibacter sp. XHJ-5]
MPATDLLTDGELIQLPPEAGDVNAPRFDPDDDWLRRASADEQKTAMWRWFATRYEDPNDPETAGPHDGQGRRAFAEDDGPFHADEVLHARFDRCVPAPVVDALVQRLQQQVGNDWARRGGDGFGG